MAKNSTAKKLYGKKHVIKKLLFLRILKLLGLERDVYLSVVKFLDSSILRKV
jgi:hypothetical protein